MKIQVDWKQTAAITVSLAGIFLGVWLVGKYALSLFLPFLIAFFLALLTRPVVCWLSHHTRCPKRILSVAVTLLSLSIVSLLCYFLCSRLLVELQNFILFLIEDSADPAGKLARFASFFKDFFARIPFVEHLRGSDFFSHFVEDGKAFFAEQLQSTLSGLSAAITGGVAALLRGLPSFLLFLLITLICCFYVSAEYERVVAALVRLVPRRYREQVPLWRARIAQGFRRYLRAYFLLFLLTLGELLLGFLILGVDYLFLLALLTALLDILPVLGVGTVLVPFSIFSFVTGDPARGIGLLILYGVITVIRQIAEPHLVGKSLGLHPILMLVSFYAGFRLFGVVGVFLGPALALLVKSLLIDSKEKTPAP